MVQPFFLNQKRSLGAQSIRTNTYRKRSYKKVYIYGLIKKHWLIAINQHVTKTGEKLMGKFKKKKGNKSDQVYTLRTQWCK